MAASLENEFRIDHKFENNYIATLDMFTIKISMVFTCKIGD
jgi:hypothetical protein